MTDFEEYIRQGEPDKREKSIIWRTAIGLQAVDGLKPSAFLIETARQNIEGDITLAEVKTRVDNYYKTHPTNAREEDDRTEEADKVSTRIAEILSEKTFSFSPVAYMAIHRHLFQGIYELAGEIRDYNITKSEWVLDGETVLYAPAQLLRETLEYDFNQEKEFRYKGLSKQQIVEHIARFAANLWQIHIFGEGNTRTTAVFLIKYLRKIGFPETTNDLFVAHSWYFRNALVRANYENVSRGVHKTDKYLVRFFSNLLLGENNALKNRELHIDWVDTVSNVTDKLGVNENTPNLSGVNKPKKLGVNVPKKLGVKLNKNQSKMLELIATDNRATIAQIAASLSISATAVENNIRKLREKGILSRAGSDKTGHWLISK